MPAYQIHRIKDAPRQQFRWAPHTIGLSVVKLKDYEPGAALEAPTPYAAWLALRDSGAALNIGDILESEGGLRIYKYVGFEEARWFVPEPPNPVEGGPVEAAPPAVTSASGAIT